MDRDITQTVALPIWSFVCAKFSGTHNDQSLSSKLGRVRLLCLFRATETKEDYEIEIWVFLTLCATCLHQFKMHV